MKPASLNHRNIIISGGGTGGHIYPAVAIANELKQRYPECNILFVGAEGKMEMEKVPKAGFSIIGLPITGISRSSLWANLQFPFKLVKSLLKARRTVGQFHADLAIGVGGYASGPTLFVANLMGIPTLLQEQNSYAGITNKLLSKRARKICVAYPGMSTFFPKHKLVLTGNPVRLDLINRSMNRQAARIALELKPEQKTLLIIGGSQGALSINKAILKHVEDIAKADLQVIWQTGTSFLPLATQKIQEEKAQNITAKDFIYKMDIAYTAADVVISRAGALSVSELCLAQKPCILVPFPHAAEDHQTKNAMSLVNRGAALLVRDDELEILFEEAFRLLQNQKKQEELSRNIKTLAQPKATELIVNEIEQILTT